MYYYVCVVLDVGLDLYLLLVGCDVIGLFDCL